MEDGPALITREQAIARGLRRYFTGKPCRRGHASERTLAGVCLACSRKSQKRWLEANPEKRRVTNRVQAKRYYDSNPEKQLARGRQWYVDNPEKAKARTAAKAATRRARKVAAGGKLTASDVAAIVTRQKGRCAVCKEKKNLSMDHIMPLALGGSGHPQNFQGLCRSCNSRKHAKHPIDFNRSLGLLL